MMPPKRNQAALTMKTLFGLMIVNGAILATVLKWMADDYRTALRRIEFLIIASVSITLATALLGTYRSRSSRKRR